MRAITEFFNQNIKPTEVKIPTFLQQRQRLEYSQQLMKAKD